MCIMYLSSSNSPFLIHLSTSSWLFFQSIFILLSYNSNKEFGWWLESQSTKLFPVACESPSMFLHKVVGDELFYVHGLMWKIPSTNNELVEFRQRVINSTNFLHAAECNEQGKYLAFPDPWWWMAVITTNLRLLPIPFSWRTWQLMA